MRELNSEKLMEISGGSISGPVINALVNIINVIKEAGYSIGSGLRRICENQLCPLE